MKVSKLEKLIKSVLGESKVHPIIQDTQEALAIMGANVKKFRKNITAVQIECDKMLVWCSQMEVFVEQRQKMLRSHLDKVVADLQTIAERANVNSKVSDESHTKSDT